jgi:LysM repeat protein
MPGYLRSFGVNAHTEPMSWQRIDQELAAGRPVVVSTRAHYFVISGKDERGYNMGSTGQKVGGGTHWSQADLNRYSSQHTLVVLDPEQQPPDEPRPPAFRVAPSRASNPRELWSQSEPSPTGSQPEPTPTRQPMGQQVAQPGNGNANHTVQAGDSLWDIARRNGTTYQDIARLNGIANPDLIFPGQQLQLPGAEAPAAQKAPGGMSSDPAQIARLTEAAAQRYKIPPDILKSIFYAESTWNPGAVGDGGHSYGIGQVYSKAHPDFDRQRASQDLAYQIDYSARFLAGLYARTGNWQSAVRSYNGSGPAAERYASKVLGTIMPSRPWTQWGVS